MKPAIEVADVLDAHWPQVEQWPSINGWQLRTLSAVRRCRTAALGSHVDGCSSCGHLRISYNSCRNRALPQMPGAAKGTVDTGKRSRTAARTILSCGVHTARYAASLVFAPACGNV